MINNRIVLLDISFWQDDDYTPYKVDFKIAWANGADGVILRAGQNSWVDEDFIDYVNNAKSARLPWGAYWFFDSRVSPIPQADLFADLIEDVGFPPLGIWGDYEEVYGGSWGGERHFREFMDRLKTRFPGRYIGVYTGPDYWVNHTTRAGSYYFKDFPLWIANYKVASPAIPYPWNKYVFWQFTSEGNGPAFGAESEEIDMNYYWGDLEGYKLEFNIPNYVPFHTPDEGDNMYECRVKLTATPHINIRETPNGVDLLGDINMYPGEEFLADEVQNDTLGRPWLHSTKVGKVGWVLAGLCDYVVIPDPEPEPITHVLEVYLDGNLEYRKEF